MQIYVYISVMEKCHAVVVCFMCTLSHRALAHVLNLTHISSATKRVHVAAVAFLPVRIMIIVVPSNATIQSQYHWMDSNWKPLHHKIPIHRV